MINKKVFNMPALIQSTNARDIEISVVIPLYKCSQSINELYERIVRTLDPLIDGCFEIIFVNDGSPENDWEIVSLYAAKDERVKGINLSRNFGQHYAITAGLDLASGNWIVIMDGDLQDQPEEIIKLYNKALSGFDIVFGKRVNRQDSFLKKITSKLFIIIFNYLTDENFDSRVANFGIYSRQVIESTKKYQEKDRAIGWLISIVGFKRAEIDIDHSIRQYGKSTYSFSKRLNMAVAHMLSHSNKPLLLTVKGGMIISFAATAYAAWLMIRFFFWGNIVNGWTSLIVSLFFLSGIIILVIGMVGLYVGKIYDEVKKRPLFIVKEVINF